MRELCTQTEYFQKLYGDKGALEKLKACGFEAVDFCLAHQRPDAFPANLPDAEYDAYFRGLGRFAKEIGLKIYQTHMPVPYAAGDGADESRFALHEKCVRATGLLGAKYAVMHPALFGDSRRAENLQKNRDELFRFSERIAPVLEKCGVVACWENIFTFDNGRICPTALGSPPELVSVLEESDPELFAACADVGHALLTGFDPAETIRLFGKRLKTVHLHDNDGRGDLHLAPYTGVLDWTEIASALREVGFEGALSLEADHAYDWQSLSCEEAERTAKLLVGAVGRLRKEIV